MSVPRIFMALLVASAAAGAALAQSPAPAQPADASQCTKPDPHPGRLASPQVLRSWNKEVTTWQDCMKKYIADIQAKADAAIKAANSMVAESNAAIQAYNATVKELQAQADAAK